MRTHQRPVSVALDALHEQIGNPHSEEKITGTVLLRSSVLATVEELEDVGVPRLEVDGKRSRSLKTFREEVSKQERITV